MKKNKNAWRLIAKSLGEKSGKDNKEADKIAFIRLMMFLSILITNSFIVYGVLRTHHFPTDKTQRTVVVIEGDTIPDYQPPPKRGINRPFEFE